eukprot:1154967-Pelagomonas_calceolata.AAC.1
MTKTIISLFKGEFPIYTAREIERIFQRQISVLERKEKSTSAKRLRALRKGSLTSKLARVLVLMYKTAKIELNTYHANDEWCMPRDLIFITPAKHLPSATCGRSCHTGICTYKECGMTACTQRDN